MRRFFRRFFMPFWRQYTFFYLIDRIHIDITNLIIKGIQGTKEEYKMMRRTFKDFMYVLIEENLYKMLYKRICRKLYWVKEQKRVEKEFAEIPEKPIYKPL